MDTKTKNLINRKLHALSYNTYFDSVPLDAVFNILKESTLDVVDEDGNQWAGLLLGSNSYTTFKLSEVGKPVKTLLYLSWYKMPSGRYEIVSYIS